MPILPILFYLYPFYWYWFYWLQILPIIIPIFAMPTIFCFTHTFIATIFPAASFYHWGVKGLLFTPPCSFKAKNTPHPLPEIAKFLFFHVDPPKPPKKLHWLPKFPPLMKSIWWKVVFLSFVKYLNLDRLSICLISWNVVVKLHKIS